MAQSFLIMLSKGARPANIGGKAATIQQLIDKNIRVPLTHVCAWDAYEAQLVEASPVLAAIKEEIVQKLDLTKSYAVRSSANVEDGHKFSFAGQFTTVLNVSGLDNILEAIQTVWDSARNPTLQSYLEDSNSTFEQLRMAVIIQEMVNPVVSGVAFSKNPMTGLDEIVVEAVVGSGEALVQDGVNPDRWVHKWGAWIQEPTQSQIDSAIITEVVEQTKTLAKTFKRPLDLEWVYSGAAVYWVQQREITTPDDINIYSNRISREVLPGIIKPLVWSINVPLVNSAWIDIFTELIGPNDIEPDDLSKAFHYRAYFNMKVIGQVFAALGMPQETLEVMMELEGGDEAPKFRPSNKILKHMPRMLKFAVAKLRYGRDIETFLPQMDRTYATFAAKPIAEMSEQELLAELDLLIAFTKWAAYMNIVGPLLMLIYNGMFKRSLARADIDYEDFDLTYDLAEIEQYDPNVHLDKLHHAFRQLDPTLQAEIQKENYADFQAAKNVPKGFATAVAQFIDKFGHLSDSGNDFSRIPWREDPDFVLDMIVNRDEGCTKDNNQGSEVKYSWQTIPLSKSTKWRLNWQYQRARHFRLYREAISFKYTYGYGLIRNYVLVLAKHFVSRGILSQQDDIFYLYMDEVRAIVAGNIAADYADLVSTRQQEILDVKDIVLPEIIYGDDVPPPETQNANNKRLSGIPTSGGYFKGTICVIQDMHDFEKMHTDAVLVIPYSDVAWTPLFAKAGAVIAESGGMLSHSSIVAREYRVPAVVSVNGACHLLQDGMFVAVDGFKGEILIEKQKEELAEDFI